MFQHWRMNSHFYLRVSMCNVYDGWCMIARRVFLLFIECNPFNQHHIMCDCLIMSIQIKERRKKIMAIQTNVGLIESLCEWKSVVYGKVRMLKVDDNANITIWFKCKLLKCIVKVALPWLTFNPNGYGNGFPFNLRIVCIFFI